MALPGEILNQFPPELQPPIKQMGEWIHDYTIPREDFTSLRVEVQVIAESLKRTENRVNELSVALKDLAESQKRTEHRVDELAESLKRTEHRVDELSVDLKELAEAQKRTDLRVEQLAVAMNEGFQKINNQISALGGRWGIKNEITFRNTISALMMKAGYSVSRGYFGEREVDLVIKNGEHILLEITSSALKKDVRNLNLSADDYFQKVGIEPKLMIAAVYVPYAVMHEIMKSPRKIEVISDEEDTEE